MGLIDGSEVRSQTHALSLAFTVGDSQSLRDTVRIWCIKDFILTYLVVEVLTSVGDLVSFFDEWDLHWKESGD